MSKVNTTGSGVWDIVNRQAQEIEVLYDIIGDLLNTDVCEYDDEEFCQQHKAGRPCPHEIARSVINARGS